MRQCMRVGLVPLAVLAMVAGWHLTYPEATDAKGIRYVLWKTGMVGMNLDAAMVAMMGDAHRDRLVLGKTRAQLLSRFGELLTPAEASAYLRGCYERSAWNGKDVVFLRHSSWMVAFDHGTATELVAVKGC